MGSNVVGGVLHFTSQFSNDIIALFTKQKKFLPNVIVISKSANNPSA